MRNWLSKWGWLILTVSLLSAVPAFAQDRETLQRLVRELQSTAAGSTQELQLQEQIVGLAQHLSPLPQVPEEVVRYEGRAEAAARSAKSAADFDVAANEYRQASRLAPWVPIYYFNLGVVLEKAERPREALQAFRLYLLADPQATDRRDVQKKIAGLEFMLERQSAPTSQSAPAAAPSVPQIRVTALAGAWLLRDINLQLNVTGGNRFELYYVSQYDASLRETFYYRKEQALFTGELDGNAVRGTFTARSSVCGNHQSAFDGEVLHDGKTLVLHYDDVDCQTRRPFRQTLTLNKR